MDVQESFLTKIIRTMLDKGIIQVVMGSGGYSLTTGMSGAVGMAITILWELLQELGSQIYQRLRENRSNNSIFAIIRDEILNLIRGVNAMSIIRALIHRAMTFLQGLAGRALALSPRRNTNCLDNTCQ